MKKVLATVGLGALLVAGFLFAQDNQVADLVIGELEPSILSIGKPGLFL